MVIDREWSDVDMAKLSCCLPFRGSARSAGAAKNDRGASAGVMLTSAIATGHRKPCVRERGNPEKVRYDDVEIQT